MDPIVVGYDAQSLTGKNQTGLGVYAKHLARVLEKHPETINLKLLWPLGRKPFKGTIERLIWEQYHLPMAAMKEEVDLLHVPCFSVPRFSKIPTVVTAHDLIVAKQPKLMSGLARWYFAKWIPASYRSADHIIAVSEATRDDLVNDLGIDPDKITVIYHGINPAFNRVTDPHEINRVRFKYHAPIDFFLMVGSFESRKNIDASINAFAELSDLSDQIKLILVGQSSPYQHKMMDLVREKRLQDRVLFPGFVPDRELAALYSVATAFLFPSSAEGFGLPLIEAMSTGCPIIASDLKVFHEIGGDAISYIPIGNTSMLADEMLKMIRTPSYRAGFIRKGFSKSLNFDWERASEETVRIYLKVLSKRGKR